MTRAFFLNWNKMSFQFKRLLLNQCIHSPQNLYTFLKRLVSSSYFSIHSMNFERSEIVTEWVTTSNYKANIGSHSKEILKTARCSWNFRDLLEVNGNIVLVLSKRVGDLPVVVVANFFDDCQSEPEGVRRLALFFESFKQGWGIQFGRSPRIGYTDKEFGGGYRYVPAFDIVLDRIADQVWNHHVK